MEVRLRAPLETIHQEHLILRSNSEDLSLNENQREGRKTKSGREGKNKRESVSEREREFVSESMNE